MGYYAIFLCFEWQHNRQAEIRLDRNEISPSGTITIKLPLSIPYVPDAQDFNRVQGIFQHNGTFYRLVKQKYASDTLTIVCIRDEETERLQRALNSYVSTLTDNTPEQKGDTKPFISFIKEYILLPFSLSPQTTGWQADLENAYQMRKLASAFRMPVSHPPEAIRDIPESLGPGISKDIKVQVPLVWVSCTFFCSIPFRYNELIAFLHDTSHKNYHIATHP